MASFEKLASVLEFCKKGGLWNEEELGDGTRWKPISIAVLKKTAINIIETYDVRAGPTHVQ